MPESSPATAHVAAPQHTGSVHKAWTLTASCLAMFMLILDITIVVVALPSIRASLHTSFSDVQWTIDAYSLALAALLLPAGSLADIVGRKSVFATGLAIFTLGSLLCGLANSGIELIIFRAFQGAGGAILFATSLALLAQTFTGRERGVAFSIWGAVTDAGSGLGPLLGGVLTTGIGWRWIFFVNVPVGIFTLVITLTRVKEFRPAAHRRIDVAGSAVFTAGLFALVYGLIESSRRGWASTSVIAALVAAAVLLAAFPIIEYSRRQPMFDIRLLRKPAFLGGSIAAFGLNASLYAMFLYITIFLQDVRHYSALGAGTRLAVATLAAMLAAAPAGRLSAHIPVRWLIGPGLFGVGIGLLLMGGLSAGSDWTHLIPGLIVAGFGSGMINPPLASTAVGVVRPQDSGMAAGMNNTFRQIGIATAIAALGSLYAHELAGGTGAPTLATYAHALNTLFLVSGLPALVTAALAIVLIRPRDFLSHSAPVDAAEAASHQQQAEHRPRLTAEPSGS